MAATTASFPEVTFSGKSLLTLPVPDFCQRDSATWQGHRMLLLHLRDGGSVPQAGLPGGSWPAG